LTALVVVVVVACAPAEDPQNVPGGVTNTGVTVVPGTGSLNVPLPHATLLKGAAASTNWPGITGRGYGTDRWQLKVEWTQDDPQDISEVETAVQNFYNTYKEWETAFDPLPYFQIIGNDTNIYHGSNGINKAGKRFYQSFSPTPANPTPEQLSGRWYVQVKDGTILVGGVTLPWSMRNTPSIDVVHFVRYWPTSGVTDHLTVDAWNSSNPTTSKLEQRKAAYKAVYGELKALVDFLETSPLRSQQYVAGPQYNYDELMNEVYDSLRAIIGTEHTSFANYTDFNWFAGFADTGNEKTYVKLQSDRLYEAYFGYIPDAKYFHASSLYAEPYPQN
jgi:hypothetical protein